MVPRLDGGISTKLANLRPRSLSRDERISKKDNGKHLCDLNGISRCATARLWKGGPSRGSHIWPFMSTLRNAALLAVSKTSPALPVSRRRPSSRSSTKCWALLSQRNWTLSPSDSKPSSSVMNLNLISGLYLHTGSVRRSE